MTASRDCVTSPRRDCVTSPRRDSVTSRESREPSGDRGGGGGGQGKYEAAMERFKEAVGVRTRALGAEHADVAATQYKMALVYEEMAVRTMKRYGQLKSL